MISTVSFNLNHTDLKENAPMTIKSKSGSGGGGSSTPGLSSTKQKSVLAGTNTPRGAFRDLTNASVTPHHQLSTKNKKIILQTTTTANATPKSLTPAHPNILFVPSSSSSSTSFKKLNSQLIKPMENKKKLVTPTPTPTTPTPTLKELSSSPVAGEVSEPVPRIDVMYPAPKIPLSIENKMSNQMIKSMIMTPASNHLCGHSNDTSTLYENSYDEIDFSNYDNTNNNNNSNNNNNNKSLISIVPDYLDDINYNGCNMDSDLIEPPPSPLISEPNNNLINNTFSFTDYFNQILL
ncbi:hypothetical protein PPL_07423 [Heterostelium album PN500]|uniref:Uncharacterized protein n=1 Tax=Heterostelium pallidum (strain ATCC 26659 / Pp 5 / PN500) TaxID=670386 RepID=D3BFX2_HETP5|nr:hypothetical protein PPL_07423 [Heterostelium album PN500]EFA79732.1 hypothetical protein PPL_07423 [Heterostelium album PN500]|eukprot:XP_020431853.1 hypothetical protein PPL_07423 [Heterostelium album PN500]